MTDILPVETSREVIEDAVRLNQVTILQAETGAGKSTQVPQYLLSVAKRVIVTQPRRIAAASIARRVAEEMEVELGELVGYKTAGEQKLGPSTRLLFCTDGIEVMRQLFGEEDHEDTIIVVDEAHEWNLNLELLVAWFRRRLTKDQNIKLVLMSAMVEADLLAAYFESAEVLSTKGRTFPITDISPKNGLVGSIKTLLRQQCNVLAFVPGKAEIRRTMAALKADGVDADVLPLHAGLTEAEQTACFLQYPRAKCIIATNVAQTSITVPDIDAVVDSGLERRSEIVDGVSGLYTRPISLADREQRRGRSGRVRAGIYMDCCPAEMAERSMFPKAPITQMGLEGVMLQLACVGYRFEDFEFFHRPPPKHIDFARDTLQKLGCLTIDDQVTPLGNIVNSIPIGTRYARMVASTYHESGEYKIVDDYVLRVAVLLEEGGILNRKSNAWKEHSPAMPIGNPSDVYHELNALITAESLPLDELDDLGIDSLAFERVRDARHRVFASVRSRGLQVRRVRETSLYTALVSGLSDQLYKKSLGVQGYSKVGSKGALRKLPEDSLVRDAEYIVALPWNLQVNTDLGPQTKRFLQAATAVAPEFVARIQKNGRSV